ncbi:MAG: rhodanese-like domain-containing protein [Pseudomonadota bacterium]
MRHCLPLVFGTLALCACAPESEGEGKDSTPLPLGFELAAAQEALTQQAQTQEDKEKAQASVINLSVNDLQSLMAEGSVRLIDIRTDKEVAKDMIAGAEHIPMNEFGPASIDPDDTRTTVLYCRTGRRSRILGEAISAKTGQPVTHLEGGIVAWRAADRN